MRKHDVRKWLHAVLDLLPVILIPVFMIYSHRHTIDSGSIDVPQNEVVDFNQINTINNSDWVRSTYLEPLTYDNDFVHIVCNSTVVGQNQIYAENSVSSIAEHIYVIRYTATLISGSCGLGSGFGGSYQTETIVADNLQTYYYNRRFEANNNNSLYYVYFYNNGYTFSLDVSDFQLFDLTQMFGSGNEPTLEEFNQWYPNDYYEFTLSHKELLKNTSTITYNDTDIMSQATYQLYNAVDKYFNMGNVFNLGGVYDWFNLNIFNGNSPIAIYIVWNIVLYEFVMDLMFLLYGLFMWFIDMVEKLMEKPINSVR